MKHNRCVSADTLLKSNHGLTFIEVMIVMAIVAMIGLFTASFLSSQVNSSKSMLANSVRNQVVSTVLRALTEKGLTPTARNTWGRTQEPNNIQLANCLLASGDADRTAGNCTVDTEYSFFLLDKDVAKADSPVATAQQLAWSTTSPKHVRYTGSGLLCPSTSRSDQDCPILASISFIASCPHGTPCTQAELLYVKYRVGLASGVTPGPGIPPLITIDGQITIPLGNTTSTTTTTSTTVTGGATTTTTTATTTTTVTTTTVTTTTATTTTVTSTTVTTTTATTTTATTTTVTTTTSPNSTIWADSGCSITDTGFAGSGGATITFYFPDTATLANEIDVQAPNGWIRINGIDCLAGVCTPAAGGSCNHDGFCTCTVGNCAAGGNGTFNIEVSSHSGAWTATTTATYTYSGCPTTTTTTATTTTVTTTTGFIDPGCPVPLSICN